MIRCGWGACSAAALGKERNEFAADAGSRVTLAGAMDGMKRMNEMMSHEIMFIGICLSSH